MLIRKSVTTGYGQPANTIYDWTLQPVGEREHSYTLPDDLEARVRIEIFCNRVTTLLYSNTRDPVGLAKEGDASVLVDVLERDLMILENTLDPLMSKFTRLHFCPTDLLRTTPN